MKGLLPLAVVIMLAAVSAGCLDQVPGVGSGGDSEVRSRISVSTTDATVGSGVRFDGSGSEGDIVSYMWDFGDNSTSDEENPTHAFDEPGAYTVTLTVENADGKSDSETVVIDVNSPPRAAFSVDDDAPRVGQSVKFDASDSTDEDGVIEQYTWDFGDGGASDDLMVRHIFQENGRYTVTLTVVDDAGAEDGAKLEMQVSLRVFEVSWELENETVTVQNTTSEYNGTDLSFEELDRRNLVRVSFALTWDDTQPLNVVSEGTDNFTLTVYPPDSSPRALSSEYESIVLEWSLASVPGSFEVEARSQAEASASFEPDDYSTEQGRGVWDANVYLGEAGDGLLIEGGMMQDNGNSWTLDVTYHYYVLDIREVSD